MTKPLVSAFRLRRRVRACVEFEIRDTRAAAELLAAEWRSSGRFNRVSVRSFMLGPRRRASRRYGVRGYVLI